MDRGVQSAGPRSGREDHVQGTEGRIVSLRDEGFVQKDIAERRRKRRRIHEFDGIPEFSQREQRRPRNIFHVRQQMGQNRLLHTEEACHIRRHDRRERRVRGGVLVLAATSLHANRLAIGGNSRSQCDFFLPFCFFLTVFAFSGYSLRLRCSS